jgi:hypothetical protein
MAVVLRLIVVLAVVPLAAAVSAATLQPPPDLELVAEKVRESIRREYVHPVRFNYIEEGRDIDVSSFGGVSVGPLKRYEVLQNPDGGKWRRLIAVDGKPVSAEKLAEQDAEHERHERKREARERSETPRQRASRLRKEAEEIRERDEILNDAVRVFEPSFVGRDTIDGQPVIVLDLKPRPDAHVTTDEGQRMKKFAGRMWVSDGDYRLARVRLHAVDNVTIGWGVVAKLDRGSGFDFVRKKVGDEWVASSLTIEGSGDTLMFRSFDVKAVTTYWNHRPYSPSVN